VSLHLSPGDLLIGSESAGGVTVLFGVMMLVSVSLNCPRVVVKAYALRAAQCGAYSVFAYI
jgi:hypothetical protein